MTCGIEQRIATDETLEQMLVRMDQRDLVLVETIAKLQNQLSSMTEEVGWYGTYRPVLAESSNGTRLVDRLGETQRHCSASIAVDGHRLVRLVAVGDRGCSGSQALDPSQEQYNGRTEANQARCGNRRNDICHRWSGTR